MSNELWINLPVKDVAKSKEFFTKIGFSFKDTYGSPVCAGLQIGEKSSVVMLFEENTFQGFARHPLTDPAQSTEVLLSFGAETPEEVDEMAQKVKNAGGTIISEPAENQGWMYGFAFTDPDGHRWNQLYMDMSKMPEKQS